MEAMMPVLFLDAEWRPLSVSSMRRAFRKLLLGRVEVVEYSKDRMIRGAETDYPAPSVVRVIRHFKRDRIAVKFSRLNIYTRDGFRCQYCRQRFPTEELNFDHVVPRAQGGKTTWDNIATCCRPCNLRKADRTPEEARMRLLRRPVKPRYLPIVTVQMDRRSIPPEWEAYWSVPLDP